MLAAGPSMLANFRAPDYAANLRRLMAREGLTLAQLVERTKLDHRTLKRLLKGASSRSRARCTGWRPA